MGEKRSNHTVYNVTYHFVWCPKYRQAILEPIEDSLEESFRDVCEKYGYEILSLHTSPDHVHLFLSAHPKHAPGEIVRTVKSITARDVGTARAVLGGISVGRWALGRVILRRDGRRRFDRHD